MQTVFVFLGILEIDLYSLAWERSAAQVTKSYSRRLPALGRFYLENSFSTYSN